MTSLSTSFSGNVETMLNTIDISNYHSIQSASLELSTGLVIISGESGSGKSIFIQSILWALGHDGDPKHDNTQVTLSFDLSSMHPAKSWLSKHDLNDSDCIITRKKLQSKRSRFLINQCPVPKSTLLELSHLLMDIHGQHHHLSYLKPRQQADLLDSQLQQDELQQSVQQAHQQLTELAKSIETTKRLIEQEAPTMDLVTYYIEELLQTNCSADEFDELLKQQKQQEQNAHLSQILTNLRQQLTNNENKPLSQHLHQSQIKLSSLAVCHPDTQGLLTLIEQLDLVVNECQDQIDSILRNIASSHDSQKIKNRISELETLARKHRCDPAELVDKLVFFQDKKTQFGDYQNQLPKLQLAEKKAIDHYHKLAKQLSQHRQHSANILSKKVTAMLVELGITQAEFKISVTFNPKQTPSAYGLDEIVFLFSAAGEAIRPLSTGISGGELSRLALAIQSCHSYGYTKTLLFDEIDVGTSGHSAKLIGRLLGQIGHEHQVFSITHQPQVARYATQHLSVKKSSNSPIQTLISDLDKPARINELVRMLSGHDRSDEAMAHAQSLLSDIES